jgi:centrosomal protein CEP104
MLGAVEGELDLHYWQDCPLLMSCSNCQQVVEIATLQEHLLDECEKKGDFAACKVCGDAIEVSKMAAHTTEKACKPAPKANSTKQRCPLCKNDAVAAGKAGWLKHLFDDGCTGNPRNSGWRASATAVVTKKTEGGGKKKK